MYKKTLCFIAAFGFLGMPKNTWADSWPANTWAPDCTPCVCQGRIQIERPDGNIERGGFSTERCRTYELTCEQFGAEQLKLAHPTAKILDDSGNVGGKLKCKNLTLTPNGWQ